MNLLGNMLNILVDLKENHRILAVKAEFEDEGSNFKEAHLLKELAAKAKLDLAIKIGGCGALNDVYEAKSIGASTIVAPMVESSYAFKKFIQTIKTVYCNEVKKPDLFVNIETITAYQNFNDIFSIPEVKDLTGIIAGRFDLAKSIGLTCEDINCQKIFDMVNDLSIKTKKLGKEFFAGGGISRDSLDFFNRLPKGYLNGFETRKIIFDGCFSLEHQDMVGILKAIEFECMWLKNKQVLYGVMLDKDVKRLDILENRYKELSNSMQINENLASMLC